MAPSPMCWCHMEQLYIVSPQSTQQCTRSKVLPIKLLISMCIYMFIYRVSPANILNNPSFEQVTSASSPDGAYVNVPTDLGSTYLTDTRYTCSYVTITECKYTCKYGYRLDTCSVSIDGLHSLRLLTATTKGGFNISPYPVTIQVCSVQSYTSNHLYSVYRPTPPMRSPSGQCLQHPTWHCSLSLRDSHRKVYSLCMVHVALNHSTLFSDHISHGDKVDPV